MALPVPHRVASALRSRLAPVRVASPDVRWLTGDQLHLTLAFVGAMPADRLPALEAALADVAAVTAPFEIRLGRAGRFGGRGRQEVAWLGLVEGHAACVALADRVMAACRAVGLLEAPADGRPDPVARPHLTVARRATPGLPAAIEAALGTRALGWTADELVLYRSHLGPPRVRYEALARLPFGADLPPGGGAG